MATVRIYKVAELLGTSSQEVIALLKRDHGIEAKSASSTIEEVVARQFVERMARQRGLALPTGNLFADTPPARGSRKPAPVLKAEPPKPALPPPRLVRVVKPVAPPAPPAEAAPPPEPHAPEPMPEEPGAAPPLEEVAQPGRVVPPTLRLRVERVEPAARVSAESADVSPAMPARPAAPPPAPASGAGPASAARPPLAPPTRPMPPQPAEARPAPRPAVPAAARPQVPGGPRPLPAQPVRPQPPRPTTPPGRPAPSAARPGQAPMWRPPFQRRRQGRTEERLAPPPRLVAPPPITRTITLAEGMTVKDLSEKLDVRAKDVLKKLLDRRMMVTINTTLDVDTARAAARDFGADVQLRSFEEEILHTEGAEARPEDVVARAPVVTVMGHVDHGKTTLLDAIRETRVAEREAGGITQHIGAYTVTVNTRPVVFLDTPGHEAFTLMRARGARVTDVVVLVVAADDGVMPQTREAVDHARAANVPIVVAINKIDKPDANPDRVKRELSDLGLVPEQWGGQTVTVEVSAKKKQNLGLLLEMILLVADIGEFKANPKRNATGTVLEAKLDRGRGPVATILVQNGTLRVGDTFIAGPVVGRVRALYNDRGGLVKAVGPATPVEVLGLEGLPQPGDAFQALADAAKARQVALFRQTQAKERALGARGARLTLESLQQQIAEGSVKELPVIVKADVQGSAEVLAETLAKLSDERVKLRVIHAGVGAINESDVLLASASNAVIVGFSVRPDRNAGDVAEREKVDVRLHSVIYNVIDEMKKAMAGLLEPTVREVRLGVAEVRETFKIPKVGTIAGCMVVEGRVTRSGDAQARLLRDHAVVYEGKVGSLRRFKDDVSEVKAGLECGIGLERFGDIKVGDVIEVFAVERIATVA